MKLTLPVCLLLLLNAFCTATEPVISLHDEALPAWLPPIHLGDFQSVTAEQIFGAPFTLRCESRQITFGKGRTFTLYNWWIRNELALEVSIATVRRFPPVKRVGRVYGATWASMSQNYLNTEALYGVRTLLNGQWIAPERYLRRNPNLVEWVALQPQEEKKIHSCLREGKKPLDALAIVIPFQIGELEDDAILHWVR